MRQSKTLAVIGDPVAHSLSPPMHEAAIASAGLEARYIAIRVAPAELAHFLEDARNGSLDGFNVTIPHKETILPLLDGVEGLSIELGAVNTVVCESGRLIGVNTDVDGFSRALKGVAAMPPWRALVLGAGGTARAVSFALRQMGTRVGISARRSEQAMEMVRVVDWGEVVPWERRATFAEGCDLVVNATPMGMSHLAADSPLPRWRGASGKSIAFDLVYGRETPFLRDAARAGWTPVNGVEMLVQQGAEAFRRWFGIEPDLASMRKACGLEDVPCSAS